MNLLVLIFDYFFPLFNSVVRLDAGMSTEKSQDEFAIMEEQIRQLASELREKNERVEQLEAILADDERLAQLETIERLEADWTKEHELVLNEREEELRLLQEVADFLSLLFISNH